MTRLVYLPPAKADAAAAAKWYESIRPGLGRRFIDRLDEIGERLLLLPESGSPVRGSAFPCRRVVLGRFDYTLVYRLRHEARAGDDVPTLVIEVVAVLHCRLEPRRQAEHIASAIRMPTDIERP